MDKAAHVATVTSYTTSGGVVVVGGFTTNELAAVGGLLLAAATFVVSWVYQHKRYQLDKVRTQASTEKVSGSSLDL